MPEEKEEKTVDDFYNTFLAESKKFALDMNKRDMIFVPYDIYKQNLELMTENLRELYEILHDITMEKMFTIDFKIGDLSYTLSGRHEDSDKIIEASEKLAEKILVKILDEKKLENIKNEIRRSKDDSQRSYS